MKKFHRNLLDGMMGPKDERERLEAYERLALGAAYFFWCTAGRKRKRVICQTIPFPTHGQSRPKRHAAF